jgi:hypothetical protein
MAFALFTYPVTRPVPFRFLPLLIFVAIITLAVATVFNFAAAGFEHVPVISPDYNNEITLWYQRFVPHIGALKQVTPEAWKCDKTTINRGDRSTQSTKDVDFTSAHYQLNSLRLWLQFRIPISGHDLYSQQLLHCQ